MGNRVGGGGGLEVSTSSGVGGIEWVIGCRSGFTSGLAV